jgi:hypothetical protein
MGEEWGGRGSRTWSSSFSIVGRGADGALGKTRGLQAGHKTCERLLGLRFTRQRGAAQRLEGFACLGTGLAPLLVHRALGVRLTLLGIHAPPAVGDPARGRGHHAGTRALRQGGHGRRVGLGEHGWCLPQRGRDPGDPLQRGLGELLEVLRALEGTGGHPRGRAIGGVEWRPGIPDHLAQLVGITAMATERLHQDRETGLMLHAQLPHDWVQVGAMRPTLAVGEVHALFGGGLLAVRAAIDMEAGGIEMGEGRCKAQALGRRGGNEAVERGQPRLVPRIEGASAGVIIAITGLNAWGNETRERLMVEKMGHEGELLVDEAKAVQDHGFDRMAYGDQTHCRIWRGRLIHDLGDAEFFEPTCDKAQMISDLRAV